MHVFRVAVAFAALRPELARRLERAMEREPGAHWELVVASDVVGEAQGLDAVVYCSDVEQRRPRSLAELRRAWCGREGDIARIPVDALDEVDHVPRRLRLARVVELTPPAWRSFPPPLQRSFGFEDVLGLVRVRLPPCGPTVTLRRLDRGVRMETDEPGAERRWVEVTWTFRGVSEQRPGGPCTSQDHDWLSVRGAEADALSHFADEVAGVRGAPRLLLEPLVRRARVWLVRHLPRHARALARPFHESVRSSVAARIAADETGRIGQLARACPGVFTLAYASPEDALDDVSRLAVDGAPLRAVLDAVYSRSDGIPWTGRRHERFLRRARAAVSPECLASPIVAGLALDDVPSDSAANAAWFRSASALYDVQDDLDLSTAKLAPFVSARGAELGVLEPELLRSALARLVLRGVHLGRWPSRKTTVAAAKQLVAPWPDAAAALGAILPAMSPDLHAPSDPRLRVRPLTTQADLAAESERLHHCIVTRWPEVERGEVIALAVEVEKERLTATVVALPEGHFFVEQVRGFANAEPSASALDAIRTWLEPNPPRPKRRPRRKRTSGEPGSEA